jgi:hypothetical protein
MRVARIALSDARYLSIHAGAQDVFAAVHHFDGSQIWLTAHPLTAPATVVSRVVIAGEHATFEGDAAVWRSLPRIYTGWYGTADAGTFGLFFVDPLRRQVEIRPLDWYAQSFDPASQGIIGAAEVPGQSLILISVQRDSRPLLYDPRSRAVIRRITLAGRLGNPLLRFRSRTRELWASDYDVLLRLDPLDWSITNAVRLTGHEAAGPGSADARRFIGEFVFNHDESLCAVARPFEGDVVALSTEAFRVTHQAVTGGQPLDVALLSDRRVFARDWKTGELLLTSRV